MAELEARWHDLGEFIREQRKVGHLSLRKLSDMAGISNPYLSQIERGLRKPSAEILQQIARALEISSETLYIRAGILEPREGDTDLITEIRPASERPDLAPVFSFNMQGIFVGGATQASQPVDRVSRWREMLLRMNAEGLRD